MNSKPKYKTKQRETLLQFLKERPGVHITVSDVCTFFREQGLTIGQSTVYRQLECMVNEGIVSKYIIDSSSPACFSYVGEESHGNGENCYHCKCENCGRLVHLHCEEIAAIQDHLLNHHDFTLNPMRTVFYGLCGDCTRKITEREKNQ